MDNNHTVFVSKSRRAVVYYSEASGVWVADAYYDGEWGGSFQCDGCVRPDDLWAARAVAYQIMSEAGV